MTNVLAVDKWNLTSGEWLNMEVTYHGNTHRTTMGNGRKFKVVATHQSAYGTVDAVALDVGTDTPEWVNVNFVEIVTTTDASDFLEPHNATLTALDAQIKVHEDKLRELRAARQVIAAL